MKKILFSLLLLLPALVIGEDAVFRPRTGKIEYLVTMNGLPIGSASKELQINNNTYTAITHTLLKIGAVTNETLQTITETKNFKPIKLTEISKTSIGKIDQKKNTIVTFNGNKANLVEDNTKRTIMLQPPFALNGNQYLSKIKEHNFEPGTTITINIYEPQINPDKTIPLTIKIIGYKDILINGKMDKLLHVSESFANLHNIDLFINQQGTIKKVVSNIMQNIMVMIIKE